MSMVRALLGAARSVAQRPFPREDCGPRRLLASLRRQGALAIADFIYAQRLEDRTDNEILAQLGWTNARRLRQYLALVPLGPEARRVIEQFSLEERQLRPMLKWMDLPHFADLLEWVGREKLSSRKIDVWSRLLGEAPSLEEARTALPAFRTQGRDGRR